MLRSIGDGVSMGPPPLREDLRCVGTLLSSAGETVVIPILRLRFPNEFAWATRFLAFDPSFISPSKTSADRLMFPRCDETGGKTGDVKGVRKSLAGD